MQTEHELVQELTTVNTQIEALELRKAKIFLSLCEVWRAQGVVVDMQDVSHRLALRAEDLA